MKVHWLLLPLLSVAVLVTVVTPTGKAEPLAGTLTTLVTCRSCQWPSHVKVTLLAHWPAAALTTMLAGQVITGGWLSRTVTVNVHVAVLPLLSVAVLVTVVSPPGRLNPLGGTLTRLVTLPQLSAGSHSEGHVARALTGSRIDRRSWPDK